MQSPVSKTIRRSWGGNGDELDWDELGVVMKESNSVISSLSSAGSVVECSLPLTMKRLEPMTFAFLIRDPKSHFLPMV